MTGSLDALFKPKTVLIYNASSKLHYFIIGFKNSGFDVSNLFLFTSREKELFGISCQDSLEVIKPEEIDLVIMAERREKLLDSVKAVLSKKKVNFIHFFTAGTGEADEKGKQIERELKLLLAEHQETRAIGPNCMGVYCPAGGNTYSPSFPTEPGNIALVFHSGDLHSKMILYGYHRYHLTFSKGASVGNCVDLQVSDFLRYYDEDEDTKVICVYFEGFPQNHPATGNELMEVLGQMKKPVLILRGGRTKRAQTAVLSHTGSLGSKAKIWEAVFKQTPAINAGKILDDLTDKAFIFNEFYKKYGHLTREQVLTRFPKGKNALLVLWSGGLGILDTDILTEQGINLPHFKGEVKKRLMDVYPLKIGSLSNPLDLPWIAGESIFADIVMAAISDDIDVVMIETDAPLNWDVSRFKQYYKNMVQIKQHTDRIDKLLIVILPEYPHPMREDYFHQLRSDDFIVYPTIKQASRSFLALQEYGIAVRNKKKD